MFSYIRAAIGAHIIGCSVGVMFFDRDFLGSVIGVSLMPIINLPGFLVLLIIAGIWFWISSTFEKRILGFLIGVIVCSAIQSAYAAYFPVDASDTTQRMFVTILASLVSLTVWIGYIEYQQWRILEALKERATSS
jgi:hypothetical protein